jgi:hypothetical protein
MESLSHIIGSKRRRQVRREARFTDQQQTHQLPHHSKKEKKVCKRSKEGRPGPRFKA